MTSKSKRRFSDTTRERMRASALARHDAETAAIGSRVRAMLTTIADEIAANGGIYPGKHGALSLTEVARRASIHPQTFFKKRYADLVLEVKAWLEHVRKTSIVGATRVRKEYGDRAERWKRQYEDLLESHRVTETDLQVMQERLASTEIALRTALEEVEHLKSQLARQPNIFRMPRRKD